LITERDDGSQFDEERLFIYQLIVNDNLLSNCRSILKPELASNKYAEYLFKWIIEYYDTTGKAPGKDITSIFVKYKDEIDEDEAKNIQTLLENIDEDSENFKVNNTQHNSENIINYFNWRAFSEMNEEMKKAVKNKDLKYAEEILTKFKRVEKTECDVYDPFINHEETSDSFNFEEERLFKLPGVLGYILGWWLRGDLVGLVAGSKAGKSWFAIFVQAFCLSLGLNILYFNLEIAKRQFTRRTWQSINTMPKEPGTYKLPHFEDDGSIYYDEIEIKDEQMITDSERIKKRAHALRLQNRGRIKTVTFPRGTATVSMLKTKTQQLEKELNFVPDVIIVDNPDVMKHRSAGGYSNENKDEEQTWVDLAGWAQELDVCVFAPTQGNRDAYNGKKFGIGGLGGSYKKIPNVGKMIMLSMGEKEKAACYSRVKLFEGIERDDGTENTSEAVVLHALGLGLWYIDSKFLNETEIGRFED